MIPKEYNEKEIGIMLHKTKKNTNILQALSATKHEHIIEEYATIETIYTPSSQFSRGFAKAVECIKMVALEAVNTRFGKVGVQDYKWANVIVDKETGDIIDLKKLLKHPEYTKI